MKGVILFLKCCLIAGNSGLISCSGTAGNAEENRGDGENNIKYARYFEIAEQDDKKTLSVLDESQNKIFEYCILPDKACTDEGECFCAPLQSIGAMAASYYAIIEALDMTDKLTVIPSRNVTHSQKIRGRAEAGLLKEVGNYNSINMELLVATDPDAVFASYTNTAYDIQGKLSELSIPVVSLTSHLEVHPLGRFEWVRFFAAFLQKEKEALALFNEVEEKYIKLRKISEGRKMPPPKVIVGYYKKDIWVAPGGNSYFAQLLADAGADYVFNEDNNSGNITVSFEDAYVAGLQADIIIYMRMGSRSWENIIEVEPLLREWPGVINAKVYSNDKQFNDYGRNNYWEQGFIEPHVILADIVEMLYPEANEDRPLVYFREAGDADAPGF